jgi:serine/threonine protein kinase
MLAPANNGQQQQQQVQMQAPVEAAAEPVAQVEGAAAGVATASADARSMARELVAVGQQVQLHLPDSVRGSFQKRLPLYVDATLGWGGQAVVLAVAHEVEEDLRPCMLLSQSAAAQEEAPCDWEQLCQLSSSCSAATAADADADADAEPTMQWDAYALKVALPWEWRHKRGGPKWQEERRKYYKDCSDALWREYRLLTKASGCDNIVRCYAWGLVRVPGYDLHLPALLLEHCDGGSLADRLWPLPAPTEQAQAGKHQSAPPELPRQPMTYEEARGYVTQVCHAVCHLNSKHIAHRDLKAGNVLTKKLADGTEQVKLADLGLAWDFSSSTATNKHGYTPTHRAPEAVAGSWCYPNVDCWGVGQLLLELREARAPFWYLLERKGLTEEERQRRRSPEELDNPDSDYYGRLEALEKAVVQDCLQPLLQKRPPLSELLLRHKKYFGLSDDGP